MQNAESRSTPRFAVRSLLLPAVCYLLSATCYLRAATPYSLLSTHYIDSLIKAAPASLGAANAVVLLERVQILIDARNNRTTERHCLVKVFNEQGREDIVAFFDQGQEKLAVLLAQVHYPDGRVVPVQKPQNGRRKDAEDTLCERGDSALCPAGSVLEYKFRLSPRKPGRAQSFSGLEPMGGYLPILNKELVVSFPRGRSLHWAQSVPTDPDRPPPAAPVPRVDTLGKTIRYVWISGQDSALPREPGEPVLARRVPQIIYSSYATWREVAETFRRQYAAALAPTVELKQKAHELAMGKSKSEAMRDIYRFVNAECGMSNSESRIPQSAFRNPHWDKACLLVSLLNAEGLNAYLLPVRTWGVPVIKDVPAPEAFDNILVVAFPDNNPAYFDPVGADPRVCPQPYGRLPESVQGAEGLVPDPKNCRFVVLPKSEFDQNVAQVSGDITLQRDGSAAGTMTLRLTGCYDAQARRLLNAASPQFAVRSSQFADRLLANPATNHQLPATITAVSETAGIAGPAVVSISFTLPPSSPQSAVRNPQSLNPSFVLPSPELALETLFALTRAASRRTNLDLPPWRICRFICMVRPGDGVSLTQPGPTWIRENPCVRATCTWKPGSDGIEFGSEFLLKKTDLNPDDYRQLKTVADEFRKPGLRELRISAGNH